MARINKELAYHGLMNIIFIMMVVRQSDVDMVALPNIGISSYESSDGGPVLIAPSAVPSGLHSHSRKSLRRVHEPMMDEYDWIMQDVRTRSPVIHGSDQTDDHQNNIVTTMVLGMPESPAHLSHGGLQFSRRYPTDGAVGGLVQSFMNDENLDIFNNFVPGNMGEDEINELIASDGVPSLDQTFPDIDWQQFISDYDQFLHGASGITKSVDSVATDWSTPDLLSEAIQTSELFLPMPSSSQNSSEFNPTIESSNDPITQARLEMMEFSEWASQDHQEDLLFPSLPPPSYEQVTQPEQLNATVSESVQQVSITDHLHDHNYCNASSPPAITDESVSVQSASYSIRSRHEVSTRVISVPPRPRHISSSAESSSSSIMEEAVDSIEASQRLLPNGNIASPVDMTEVVEQSSSFDSFVIKPLNLTYFDNISKTVGARREVILCN